VAVLKTHMPGTKGDAVALHVHLLLQKIPEVWQQKVAFMESAHVALKWIVSQLRGMPIWISMMSGLSC
jgi:hypothetical protein